MSAWVVVAIVVAVVWIVGTVVAVGLCRAAALGARTKVVDDEEDAGEDARVLDPARAERVRRGVRH